MENNYILTHLFSVDDKGKNCLIFRSKSIDARTTGMSSFIRLEDYRNVKKLKGVTEHLSVRINGKWNNLSALFPTPRKNVFFGNISNQGVKTLIVVFIDRENGFMRVMEMPKGYYPNYGAILSLVNRL